MSLKEEIAEKRKDMIVDSYPMSIGEVMNLYKDGELDVHPEFQRFFRWDEEQKTKLIESMNCPRLCGQYKKEPLIGNIEF